MYQLKNIDLDGLNVTKNMDDIIYVAKDSNTLLGNVLNDINNVVGNIVSNTNNIIGRIVDNIENVASEISHGIQDIIKTGINITNNDNVKNIFDIVHDINDSIQNIIGGIFLR
ncbi:hypothetical protein QLX08_006702 [Tetragonisca angustula]|uniref:Uncharacterized protein n=1 Tax=Tetragonisca angustula TaxID=166442 RepID=A0AAW0ZSX1_9HYME